MIGVIVVVGLLMASGRSHFLRLDIRFRFPLSMKHSNTLVQVVYVFGFKLHITMMTSIPISERFPVLLRDTDRTIAIKCAALI